MPGAFVRWPSIAPTAARRARTDALDGIRGARRGEIVAGAAQKVVRAGVAGVLAFATEAVRRIEARRKEVVGSMSQEDVDLDEVEFERFGAESRSAIALRG